LAFAPHLFRTALVDFGAQLLHRRFRPFWQIPSPFPALTDRCTCPLAIFQSATALVFLRYGRGSPLPFPGSLLIPLPCTHRPFYAFFGPPKVKSAVFFFSPFFISVSMESSFISLFFFFFFFFIFYFFLLFFFFLNWFMDVTSPPFENLTHTSLVYPFSRRCSFLFPFSPMGDFPFLPTPFVRCRRLALFFFPSVVLSYMRAFSIFSFFSFPPPPFLSAAVVIQDHHPFAELTIILR